MSYFIRSEITYHTGEHSVTFWRGPSDPTMWVFHHSDAAQYPTIKAARTAYKQATGYFPGKHPQDAHTINVVLSSGVVSATGAREDLESLSDVATTRPKATAQMHEASPRKDNANE